MERPRKIYEVQAHGGKPRCAALGATREGSLVLVSGGDDGRAELCSLAGPDVCIGLPVGGGSNPTAAIGCVTLGPGCQLATAGAADGTVLLWDLDMARAAHLIAVLSSLVAGSPSAGPRAGIGRCSLGPASCSAVDIDMTGHIVAGGSVDERLWLWDTRQRASAATSHWDHGSSVACVKFSPDGAWVVSGGRNGCIKVWSLQAGRLMHSLVSGGSATHKAVVCLEYHPEECLLATGSADGSLCMWDLEKFELIESTSLMSPTPGTPGLHALAASESDRRLIVATAESLMACAVPSSFAFCHGACFALACTWEPVTVAWGIPVGCPGDVAALACHGPDVVACKLVNGGLAVWSTSPSSSRVNTTMQHSRAPMSSPDPPELAFQTPRRGPEYQEPHLGASTQSFSGQKKRTTAYRHGSVLTTHSPAMLRDGSSRSQKLSPTRETPAQRRSSPQPAPGVIHDLVVGLAEDSWISQATGVATHNAGGEQLLTASEGRHQAAGLEHHLASLRLSFKGCQVSRDDSWVDKTIEPAVRPRVQHSPPKTPGVTGGDLQQLLGLDIGVMQRGSQGWQQDSRQSEDDIIKDLLEKHDLVSGVLQGRLTKLKVIRSFWSKGDLKGAAEAMERMQDDAIVVDVLEQKGKQLDLEWGTLIMPLLLGLLNSPHERHVKVSIAGLASLWRSFGGMITASTVAASPPGVDIHAEERQERCQSCLEGFKEVALRLTELAKRGSGGIPKDAAALLAAIEHNEYGKGGLS
eukprot:SM000159S01783  [mRNA]  locus=s159:183873:188645:+ [translate_table: standard]